MSCESTSSQPTACRHPKTHSGALRDEHARPERCRTRWLNRNTATLYYRTLREIIVEQIAHDPPVSDKIEVVVSYFDEYRKETRGGGAGGKIAVFGLLKRHLRRYNGIPRKDFNLFLAECEWRFNICSPAKLRKKCSLNGRGCPRAPF